MKHSLLLLLPILILVACTEKSASEVSKNGYVQCKIAGAPQLSLPSGWGVEVCNPSRYNLVLARHPGGKRFRRKNDDGPPDSERGNV